MRRGWAASCVALACGCGDDERIAPDVGVAFLGDGHLVVADLAEARVVDLGGAEWFAVAPDRSRAAVGVEAKLFVVDVADGSTLDLGIGNGRNDSGTGSALLDFEWAPDGMRLAYFAGPLKGQPGAFGICLPDGSERRELQQVTWESGIELSWHRWSPGASRLAYALAPTPGGAEGLSEELHTVSQEGSGDVVLASGLGTFYEAPFVNYEGSRQRALWSKDGSRIAFVRHETSSDSFDVWTASGDGSDARRAHTLATWVESMSWSPTGRRLTIGTAARTIVVEPEEGGRIVMDTGKPPDSVAHRNAATWSPTEDRLAYFRVVADARELRIFAEDDSDTLVVSSESTGPPSWDPTGQVLAFVSGGLHLCDADGSHDRVLSPTGTRVAGWNSEGDALLVSIEDPTGEVVQVLDRSGRVRTQFTVVPQFPVFPYIRNFGWARDGRFIVYWGCSTPCIEAQFLRARRSDGSGEMELWSGSVGSVALF